MRLSVKHKGTIEMWIKNKEISPETIEHFIRQAHIERSKAFADSFKSAVSTVKNIFSVLGSGEVAGGHR